MGASEFRTGLLTRPSYVEYVKNIGGSSSSSEIDASTDTKVAQEVKSSPARVSPSGPRRRRTTARSGEAGEDVPASLRRIHSRKMEAGKLAAKN